MGMGLNKKIHQRQTTPIINSLNWCDSSLMRNQLGNGIIIMHQLLHDASDGDLVSLHKEKLGRQTTTYTTDRRYWIWDMPLWRVYVNNQSGVGFELPIDVRREACWEACWDAYHDYLGRILGPYDPGSAWDVGHVISMNLGRTKEQA